MAAKEINFDDIRKGDTIRVTDVREIKIATATPGYEIRDGGEVVILRESPAAGAWRTFYLLEREYEKLPTIPGTLIELKGNGEVWVLIHESHRAYAPLWVNTSNGTRQSVSFMQNRANEADGFEVLA